MAAIEFFVPGRPRTAGSKRAFPIRRRDGSLVRIAVTDDSGPEGKAWRAVVQDAARAVFPPEVPLLSGHVELRLEFQVMRPKGHYGARGLRASAPVHPTTKPDLLKMARAVEDALTGVLWRDDAQIVTEILTKRYADRPGVVVRVGEESPRA